MALEQLNKQEYAIKCYNEVIGKFGCSDETDLLESAGIAINIKKTIQKQLNKEYRYYEPKRFNSNEEKPLKKRLNKLTANIKKNKKNKGTMPIKNRKEEAKDKHLSKMLKNNRT